MIVHPRIQQVLDDASTFDDAAILTADGLDDAIIGYGRYWDAIDSPVIVYDADKIIQILMKRDGMSKEDALDFFYFNIEESWCGKGSPMFVWTNGLIE